MENGIAFFDLDGTITSNDTFIDFIVFCRGKFPFFLGLLILSPYLLLFTFKLYPNYKLKELFFKYYLAEYYSEEKLENLGKLYALNRLPSVVYKEAIKQINWHKKNDHKVIILTASSPLWLSDWCKINQIDIIGTEFEKKDGKYTGKISGKNCYGQQKLIIVDNILKDTGISLTYGYGDSKADKPFLSRLKYGYFRPFWIQSGKD